MSEEKTPTERVRELLDERGIDFKASEQGGKLYVQYSIGPLTPEQAIAATVGCEPDEKELLKLHDRMNDAMLRYEHALGTEHSKSDAVIPFVSEMHIIIEDAATVGRSCASCPEMDNSDSYIRHLSAALEYEQGECHNDALKTDQFYCSKCGIDLDIVKLSADVDYVYEPKWCPECGSRVTKVVSE